MAVPLKVIKSAEVLPGQRAVYLPHYDRAKALADLGGEVNPALWSLHSPYRYGWAIVEDPDPTKPLHLTQEGRSVVYNALVHFRLAEQRGPRWDLSTTIMEELKRLGCLPTESTPVAFVDKEDPSP